MNVPNPERLLRLLIASLLILYISKLATGRGRLFWNEWTSHSKVYYKALEQHEECKKDKVLHLWEDGCREAGENVLVWPLARAWATTLDKTYLCIEYPCSELITSWTGLLLALLLVGLFVVYFRGRRVQTRYHPVAYQGHIHDDVAYAIDARVEGGTLRRRLLGPGNRVASVV